MGLYEDVSTLLHLFQHICAASNIRKNGLNVLWDTEEAIDFQRLDLFVAPTASFLLHSERIFIMI